MTDLGILTERTLGGLKVEKVQQRLPFINVLDYGDSGVGKTMLAGSASQVPEMSPVLFVDIEGGTFSLRTEYPDIDIVRVQNWQQMQGLYNELFKNEHGYRTVVLDSLTEIQKFSMYGIMKELVAKEPDRDPDIPSVREWGKNIEQIRLFVRAFRDLPINTIFTALAMTEKNPRTGMMTTRPALSGKLSNEVAAFLDIVLYHYVKVQDGEPQRFLLANKTEEQIAKDRSGKLPLVIETPTMTRIHSLIFGNQTIPETSEETEDGN